MEQAKNNRYVGDVSHASSEPKIEKPHDAYLDVSISDAKTQSVDEHTHDATNEVLADTQPENIGEPENDIDIEP